jgi:tripartite-type tricarboxylate transporter receptor subunit TctC
MAIPNNSPYKTLADFIARAKADPGKLTFGSPGHGAVPHLSAELFVRAADIQMTHVPYRGAAPGIQDLIPGRIDSFFNNIAPMVPLAEQGTLRLLGVTTAKRSPMMPNLPAIGETLKGYDVTGWYALFVPAKTPKEIIQQPAARMARASSSSMVSTRLLEAQETPRGVIASMSDIT